MHFSNYIHYNNLWIWFDSCEILCLNQCQSTAIYIPG